MWENHPRLLTLHTGFSLMVGAPHFSTWRNADFHLALEHFLTWHMMKIRLAFDFFYILAQLYALFYMLVFKEFLTWRSMFIIWQIIRLFFQDAASKNISRALSILSNHWQ